MKFEIHKKPIDSKQVEKVVTLDSVNTGDMFRFASVSEKDAFAEPEKHFMFKTADSGAKETGRIPVISVDFELARKLDGDRLVVVHKFTLLVKESEKTTQGEDDVSTERKI